MVQPRLWPTGKDSLPNGRKNTIDGSTNRQVVQKARKRLGWGGANGSSLNAFLGLMTYVYSEYPDGDDASYKEGVHPKSVHLSQGAHLLQGVHLLQVCAS